MFKTFLILLLSCFVCLIFSSSISEVAPDPTLYSKKFFEVLKKNNPDLYVSLFEITDSDIDFIINLSVENPYLSKNELEELKEELAGNSSLKNKLKDRLKSNYTKVQDWIKENDITINTIEYLTFYYTIQLEKNTPFHTIKLGQLYIKHGTKFYRILLEDVIFINNQWKYGEINGIEEVDQYLNYVDSYENAVADTVYYDQDTAMDPNEKIIDAKDAYEYDTPYVEVDTAFTYSPDYKVYSDKVYKKVLKLQKKIDALYEKEDKIYSK